VRLRPQDPTAYISYQALASAHLAAGSLWRGIAVGRARVARQSRRAVQSGHGNFLLFVLSFGGATQELGPRPHIRSTARV